MFQPLPRLRALLLGVLMATACAHPPPSLGPAGQLAWKQHEIQKDLDLVRDLAQDGSAQTPPVISVATARRVTLWHETAIQAVHDAPKGWQAIVLDGVQGLKTNLPPTEAAILTHYLDLVVVVVKGVQ